MAGFKMLKNYIMCTFCASVLLIASSFNSLLYLQWNDEEELYGQYPYQSSKDFNGTYAPSFIEKYIIDNSERLGYASLNDPPGCTIWKDPSATNDNIHAKLTSYSNNLDKYIAAVKNFTPLAIDILDHIKKSNGDGAAHDVCDRLKLLPSDNVDSGGGRSGSGGLSAIFPSHQLSLTKSGFIEPLLPPMRHHKLCWDFFKHIMSLDYLIHDFEAMCHNIKATSRRVLIDMGASLVFHDDSKKKKKRKKYREPPIVTLMNLYEKFGFQFDHIYAFEVDTMNSRQVYEDLLPEKYFASYHWINAGVTNVKGHKMNPLHSILTKFDEDDFIVIKLDIDTPSIELPLAHQLVEGGPDGIYHRMVDQFYFEHHVHLGELAESWERDKTMEGTVKDSLEMFHSLRERGIPAHFWP